MPLNRELVERKISLILDDLERLKETAELAPAEYLADYRNEVLTERYLERIIGRLIDISFHIVSVEALKSPRDYYSCFRALGELGILDEDTASRFASLSGLRNRLAHEYNGIDEKIIHRSAREMVTELPRYLEAIRNHW